MRILWILFEIGINIYQGWLYCFFLHRRLCLKPGMSVKRAACMDVLMIMGVACFYSLYIWFDVPVTDTVIWIFTTICSFAIFSDKKLVILAWNACLGILMLCIVNLCSTVTLMAANTTWEKLMEPTLLRVGFVLCTNVIAFIVLYTVTRLKPKQDRLSILALLIYIVLNAALIGAIEMQYRLAWTANVPQRPVLITIFSLLFAAVCAIVLLELLSHAAEERGKLEAQIAMASMRKTHLQEVRALYEELREYQHNLKHQYALLKQMFENGHIEEGRKYLNALDVQNLLMNTATGNLAVDAVLSAKQTHMRQLNIDFEFIAYPMTVLPMDETDFCTLLGNLLDNAIEAIQRMPQDKPRHILLKFAKTRNMLCITCINNANTSTIHMVGGQYLSSKRKYKMGYGLSSIYRIVERAGGLFQLQILQDKATAEIMIPFEEV